MFIEKVFEGKNNWWRYVATLIITLLGLGLGNLPIIVIAELYAAKHELSGKVLNAMLAADGFSAVEIGANMGFFLMLFAFAVALIALLLCIRYIHKRPILSVLTIRKKFDCKRLLVAAGIWLVFGSFITWVFIPSDLVTYQFDLMLFLPLLLIALVMLPLQVAAEEVLFRGYLMQMVGQWFSRPIIPLVVTSLIFVTLHLANPEFQNDFLKIVPSYLAMSFGFGVLALLDDGLELPIGAHLGNNLFAALILSTSDGAMNTASIFQTKVALVIDVLPSLLLVIPAVLLVLHLIYKFKWSKLIATYDNG